MPRTWDAIWEAKLGQRPSFTRGEHEDTEVAWGDEARLTIDIRHPEAVSIGLSETAVRPTGFYWRFGKRALDVFVGSLMLILSVPLLLTAGAAILLTMGAPVILKQDRVGWGGHLFTMYKFRTMDHDRRTQDLPYLGSERRQTHKSADDPRITRVGRFLRKWSLDELPQLWNVVKGDMSLVGPRPELPAIVSRYEPWQHHRHLVRPGLTGLWQISERGQRLLHECTEMDLKYIEDFSALRDLRILVRTPFAALGLRRGI